MPTRAYALTVRELPLNSEIYTNLSDSFRQEFNVRNLLNERYDNCKNFRESEKERENERKRK